ncbi:radical SAM protein [uncultured Clostridium sp.]|uniref:radical SAM protein n=1 Tax=uncultured Clostridium sp. TaxID=59620 RepID=UPI0028E1EB67|nr:radical SAM protein [uncultured Clostridium sp.]
MYRDKKIVLFGASYDKDSTCDYVINWLSKEKYSIEYLVDNDENKQGKEVYNKQIRDPKELLKENRDNILIIVTSGYVKEISYQLQEMGFKRKDNFIRLYDWNELRGSYVSDKLKKSITLDSKGNNIPTSINLEITSFCNMECCYCPYHSKWIDKSDKAPNVMMTEDIFNKILKQLKNIRTLRDITIGGRGECLLHPKWFEFAQSISKNTSVKEITLLTNGKLLNDVNNKKISELNFERINILISIDGYSENENSYFRINSDYSIIKENLNKLIKLTQDNSRIKISIMNVKVPNIDEVHIKSELDIAEYIKKDFPQVSYWGTYAISFYKNIENKFIEQGFSIVEGVNENLFICTSPFKQIAINSSGKVLACSCGNGQNKVVGVVEEENLISLWNNDEFKSMRKDFLNRKNPSICNLCANNIELKPYRIICRGEQ